MQAAPGAWWIFAVAFIAAALLVWIFIVVFLRVQQKRLEVDRRQLEELSRREEKYRSIVANSIAGLIRIRVADRKLLEANEAALAIMAVAAPAELEARLFGAHAVWMEQLLSDLAASGSVAQREFPFDRPAGSEAWCLVSARLNTREGTADLVLVDITEQQRLHRSLLHAHRMELMGTLAAGIAHDINNILTPMVLSVEQLENGGVHADLRPTVAMVGQGVDRARLVADQFLTLARGMNTTVKDLRLNGLITEALGLLKNAFSKTIAVNALIPPDLWAVKADGTQIQQVLINLCVNARDAMPHGGRLTIDARNVPAHAGGTPLELDPALPYVCISVADTGTGIAAEHLLRIFDPFFTTKPQGSGTGLGLAMCQHILSAHHGLITAASTPGEGSVFTFWIPATDLVPVEPLPDPEPPIGDRDMVLVVDDDVHVLLQLDSILSAEGYRVLTSDSREEGWELFRLEQHQLEAVLCDLQFPAGSGVSLIRKICAIETGVGVVAMSGNGGTEAWRSEVLPAGVGFLQKPFGRTALMGAVRSARGRRLGITDPH